MIDPIERQDAINVAHKVIFDFFDICSDDEESPITYKDELLLEVNKALTKQIKQILVERRRWKCVSIGKYACSLCGFEPYYGESVNELRYCPNCGSKME